MGPGSRRLRLITEPQITMDNNEHESEERGLPLEHVLTDTSDRRLALLWAGLTALTLVITAAVFVTIDDVPPVVYVVLGVVSVVMATTAYLKGRVWAAWDNPQLFLPSSAPLHLGDHVFVRFRRTARGSSELAGMKLTAALRVEERVSHTLGSETHAVSERVYDTPVSVSLNVYGRTVEADLEIDIPLFDAPPTMNLPNNEIHWELWVRMEVPNAPDDDTTFPLVVAPIVAERLQSGGSGR
jgi:hypothetical protein